MRIWLLRKSLFSYHFRFLILNNICPTMKEELTLKIQVSHTILPLACGIFRKINPYGSFFIKDFIFLASTNCLDYFTIHIPIYRNSSIICCTGTGLMHPSMEFHKPSWGELYRRNHSYFLGIIDSQNNFNEYWLFINNSTKHHFKN